MTTVASERYFSAADGVAGGGGIVHSDDDELRCTVFCMATLSDGRISVGVSTCNVPEHFSMEQARSAALADAIAKAKPAEQPAPSPATGRDERIHVSDEEIEALRHVLGFLLPTRHHRRLESLMLRAEQAAARR